ncbi:unnamed protein product [Gongylonema pulchrum]|uniref:Hexosyltransferase n=1 Tax=Gongylonema pulchrum TaxID=637853 RepID=A0A3P6SU60_9BILA|nr:unnamed protein product [Gongylonema pulchrum]
MANYLERSLFPLRLLCYTQYELLTVPSGSSVDSDSCLRRFFPFSKAKNSQIKKCLHREPTRLLIGPKIERYHRKISVVRSAPTSLDYRDYIRETWKTDMEPDIPVIFVLGTGTYDPAHEAQTYQDIMQFDFVDSYFNLTLKMTSVYRYLLSEFPELTEIIVINDDAIVNATALRRVSTFSAYPVS